MESVFITIHDLTLDARVKFCSDSIEDILGYLPSEVKGKSCWEYFHPDEIPFAKSIHAKGIDLDKAAVLNYCRVKHKDGTWIGCECVFTVVHDVLVASTSVYRRGPKSQRRALDGANVRRVFSSSPRDPRYHMLSFLSGKFTQDPSIARREPRAALFLNRFTRSSTIMYATSSISAILGIPAEQLVGKSFYYCIAENCLADAVKCLESAKANDSIAYLRFWFRDPTQPEARARSESIMDLGESDEEEEGGVRLESRSNSDMDEGTPTMNGGASLNHAYSSDAVPQLGHVDMPNGTAHRNGSDNHPVPSFNRQQTGERSSSDNSTDLGENANDAIFDPPAFERHTSSMTAPDSDSGPPTPFELEAVVSCTSDGLVVVLRRAQPLASPGAVNGDAAFNNGMFAAPWASQEAAQHEPDDRTSHTNGATDITQDPTAAGFMAAIRDIATFAWSLTGINGSMAKFARISEDGKGQPFGEALPPGGLVEWDPNARISARENGLYNGFNGSRHRPLDGMGDPVSDSTSSDDEIVWKRDPDMASWRRPKRRQHADAFGSDGIDGIDGETVGGSRKRHSKEGSR